MYRRPDYIETESLIRLLSDADHVHQTTHVRREAYRVVIGPDGLPRLHY